MADVREQYERQSRNFKKPMAKPYLGLPIEHIISANEIEDYRVGNGASYLSKVQFSPAVSRNP